MSSKNITKAPAAPQVANTNLSAQLEAVTAEKNNALQIAQIAANQLVYIETRFAPLLDKKFNIWNALFHIKEIVLLVKEIITMIREFRGKYMSPSTPDDSSK